MTDRPAFPPAVLEALKKGNKLEAIKLVREAGKTGLAEAKVAIEAVEGRPLRTVQHHHPTVTTMPGYVPHSKSGLSPGEVPRGGGEFGWIVVAVAALAIIFIVL